jgi:hydrogenase maturation protease
MNTKLIEDVAAAVLYEGYLLYPYRASAIKNKQRWNFGVLYPRSYAESQTGADAWSMQTECLLRADSEAIPTIRVRFLHLIAKIIEGQDWQGAMEREISITGLKLSQLMACAELKRIALPEAENQQPLEAVVEAGVERLDDHLFKIRVSVFNTVPFEASTRDQALMHSLVSAHTILSVDRGEFISLLDPPEDLRDIAVACKNSGTWPVMIGEEGRRDAMLSSPIILYDYPQIAPESPGALFDGTEIDEILTLRIMTLTDSEKLEMATDERAREILERTESMPVEQFMKMHGILRSVPGNSGPSEGKS